MKTIHLLILVVPFALLSGTAFVNASTDMTPTWTYHTDGPVDSIAISSDGNHFAAGSQSVDGGSIYYFDNQGNLLWKYTTDRHVWSVAISDDASYIAAASSKYSGIGAGHSYAGLVYLFDNQGNLLWKYDTNQTAVTEVKMSSDGSYLAVDTTNGIMFLDRKGNLLWSHIDTSTNDHPVRITKDGSLVATKDYNKLRVFDRNGTLLWENTEGDSGAFTFSDDNRFLVTSAEPSGIDLLDRNGKLIWKDEVGTHFISASISKDNSYIEASAQGWGEENSGGLFLFDNNARVLWQRIGDGISTISSDGTYIVMGLWAYQGPSVLLYDNQGNLLWQHTSGLVHSLAISHDAKYVIVGIGDSNYGDGSVQLFTNEQTLSELNKTARIQNENPPVIITQVELDSPFAFFPDNQTCYDKPGFINNYTCSTKVVPGHKVQCGYFIGSSYCEPIHKYTSGTDRNCLYPIAPAGAPQWFDVYNTQNKTIQLQYFDVRVPSEVGGSYSEDGPYYSIPSLGPHEKCTYGFVPVDEPLTLDPTNKTISISYDYEGKHYTASTPTLTDLYNDTRTWQFDGNKWVFAEQNTVTVPEFPFAIPVLIASIASAIVFYRMKFR